MADTSGRMTRLECPDWLRPPLHLVGGVLRWRALPLADRLSRDCDSGGRCWRRARRGAAAVAARGAAATRPSPPGCDGTASRRRSASGSGIRWRSRRSTSRRTLPPRRRSCACSASCSVRAARTRRSGCRACRSTSCSPSRRARFVEAHGGVVMTKAVRARRRRSAARFAACAPAARRSRRASVISTVPWHAFGRLWDGASAGVARADRRGRRAPHRSSPIVSVNLWFDGPVDRRAVRRARRRADALGVRQGRDPQRPPDRRGHVAIVASGAVDLVDLGQRGDHANAPSISCSARCRRWPGRTARTLGRRPRASRDVLGRARRSAAPPAATALAGFYLAGDWTDTGLPGTIEGAVVSGHRAARLILTR